jgi:hypothetical protein
MQALSILASRQTGIGFSCELSGAQDLNDHHPRDAASRSGLRCIADANASASDQ